jgi:mannose/fructose/N-acetylgalactosamine-specific phosphotransferase system component IIC
MFSILSKSSVGNISKVYCDYYYIMALIMIFSIALSILGLMGAIYKSMTDKREKVGQGTFIAFGYAMFINVILINKYIDYLFSLLN